MLKTAIPAISQLSVLIPRKGNTFNIDGGSGIVSISDGDTHHVYFEGNRYGAVNLESIQDRIQIAAGRLICRYPTTARIFLDGCALDEHFQIVGNYTYSNKRMSISPESIRDFENWESLYGKPNGSSRPASMSHSPTISRTIQ
jgi:hypothetical protein